MPGKLDKLAASINPFFRHYSTPRLFGLLVAGSMAGGLAVLVVLNMQCRTVKNSDVRYEEVFGGLTQQKIFVETQHLRPPDLPDSARRTATTCTVFAVAATPVKRTQGGKPCSNHVSNGHAAAVAECTIADCVGNGHFECSGEVWQPTSWQCYAGNADPTCAGVTCGQGVYQASDGRPTHCCNGNRDFKCGGNTYFETTQDWCIYPNDAVLAAYNYPEYFNWCKGDALLESIKPLFTQGGVVINPEESFKSTYDSSFPGWLCTYKDRIPEYAAECQKWDNNRVYKMCGFSADGRTTWERYDDPVGGISVPYFHGYQVIINTEEDVCPSLSGAIGAALGYLGFIELAATLLIVSLFVNTGIAKPMNENASIFNMLKGAGMAEFEEKLEKIRLKEQEAATKAEAGPKTLQA